MGPFALYTSLDGLQSIPGRSMGLLLITPSKDHPLSAFGQEGQSEAQDPDHHRISLDYSTYSTRWHWGRPEGRGRDRDPQLSNLRFLGCSGSPGIRRRPKVYPRADDVRLNARDRRAPGGCVPVQDRHHGPLRSGFPFWSAVLCPLVSLLHSGDVHDRTKGGRPGSITVHCVISAVFNCRHRALARSAPRSCENCGRPSSK